MTNLLSSLCPLVRMVKYTAVQSDSFLVSLQSCLTSCLLVTTSILLASFQLFGSPIRCQIDGENSQFIEEYCWARSTFSRWSSTMSIVYPGVGQWQDGGEVVYHSYYQYMPVVLLLLGGLCRLPHLLWSYWEGGLMGRLVPTSDGRLSVNILHWEVVRQYSRGVGRYFKRNSNSRHHHRYGMYYLATELLCLLNVILTIFTLQLFLKTFLQYLPHLLLHHLVSPLPVTPEERLFPLLAKCSIVNIGPSGSGQTQDALCLLTVNLINQKIFLVIWLWLALLLGTSSLLLVHSFLTALLPSLRRRALTQLAGGLASHTVDTLVDKLSYGDWLVVIRIVSHFTPDVVSSVLTEVERGIVEGEEEGGGDE